MIYFNAFACDPEKGSELGLGWNWLSYIGRYYPTLLVTADIGRKEILREAIDSDPELKQNVTVHFVSWELPEGLLPQYLLRYYQPYYYRFYRRWMQQSYAYALQVCREGKIKLVHQNTYHSYREPGDFWRLPVPSVWAPVAGVSNIPWRLLPSLGPVEGGRHGARNLINMGHMRWNQRFRQAVKGYSRVVAGSDEAASFLRKFRSDEVPVIPGQLIKQASTPGIPNNRQSNSEPLRLVFCGLHLSRKGGAYLIKALAQASHKCRLHLDMIGEGLMTARWRNLAGRLQCNHLITWHGRVERSRVLEIMHEADVFVFPSINDCYPAVIAEAMSVGLPVITTDVPGVGDMVDADSGIKLSAISEKSITHGLADAICRLVKNPEYLDHLFTGVKKRKDAFQFERRMRALIDIYEDLM